MGGHGVKLAEVVGGPQAGARPYAKVLGEARAWWIPAAEKRLERLESREQEKERDALGLERPEGARGHSRRFGSILWDVHIATWLNPRESEWGGWTAVGEGREWLSVLRSAWLQCGQAVEAGDHESRKAWRAATAGWVPAPGVWTGGGWGEEKRPAEMWGEPLKGLHRGLATASARGGTGVTLRFFLCLHLYQFS